MPQIALDTDVPQWCDQCGRVIETDMVVYGVGGAQYLRVYHAFCPPPPYPEQKDDNDKTSKDPRAKS